MPLWWNWQTRGTQNPVVAIPCRFDPDQRHHKERIKSFDLVCSFFARRRGRTEGSSICVAYSCRRFPLAGYGNPQRVPTSGTIKNKLNLLIWFVLFFCPTSGENRRFVNMRSIFLPKVPACGIRQSPKGTAGDYY